MNEFCKTVKCTETCDVLDGATLLIDGQALVVSLGKPQSHLCHTFGGLSNIFLNAVYHYGYRFARIDVVFDRYDPLSMKEGTRIKRKKRVDQFVVIENPDVPLPSDWLGFLADSDNKADLACLLSQALMEHAPDDKCIVTAGGLS